MGKVNCPKGGARVLREGKDGTVGKALSVLDQVAAFERPVRFSEILAASPYPKPTLYRLVQALTNQGILAFDPDRQTYAPGLRLVRLAHAAWLQSTLAPVARARLDTLSAEVGETIHLAQLDLGQVLYIEKRDALRPEEMYSETGKVGSAYCTAVGKALLAFAPKAERDRLIDLQSFHQFTPNTITSADALHDALDAIVGRGFALEDEEQKLGVVCIGVPVLTEMGRPIGGLSIRSTLADHTIDDLVKFAPALQQAARDIAYDAAKWHVKYER